MIGFNFCPEPLDKETIVKINVEVEDDIILKETLAKAINIYNQDADVHILKHPSEYKVMLSKKTGLPDLDLPALEQNLKISELNCLKFSILIEKEHYLAKRNMSFSSNKTENNLKENLISNNSLRNSFDVHNSKVEEEAQSKKESKGCCGFLLKCFMKKK